MLSPHMGKENAFRLKPCLPITSTQEVESVWELEGPYSSEVRFSHCQHSPVGIPCLLCACSAQAGAVLVTPATLFIYFDHLYIPSM